MRRRVWYIVLAYLFGAVQASISRQDGACIWEFVPGVLGMCALGFTAGDADRKDDL